MLAFAIVVAAALAGPDTDAPPDTAPDVVVVAEPEASAPVTRAEVAAIERRVDAMNGDLDYMLAIVAQLRPCDTDAVARSPDPAQAVRPAPACPRPLVLAPPPTTTPFVGPPLDDPSASSPDE